MSQERMEILNLLRDQKISAEEAERLLKALDESDQRAPRPASEPGFGPREPPFGPREPHFGRHRMRRRERGFFGEIFEGIGTMVSGIVGDSLFGLGLFEDERDLEPMSLENGGFELPQGMKLVVRSRGGDISLVPGEGSRGALLPGRNERVRVLKGPDRIVLASNGSLDVQVPATAGQLDVFSAGGNLRGSRLPCALFAKSAGGNIEMGALAKPFQLWTAGGNINLSLEASLSGDSRAETLGGEIEALLPMALNAQVDAETFGEVRVDAALGRAHEDWRHGRHLAVLEMGNPDQASLLLKSMGGTVRVKGKS
jgi:hypothetical protein